MSEFSIKQINTGFVTLANTIKEGFSSLYEIISNLNIPELFRVQNEVITEGFHNQITAMIMTQLLEKSSKVSSAEVMLKVQNKRLEKRKNRYDQHIDKIMSRTEDAITKEKDSSEQQIRQLDDPVLSLIEDYAQEKIHSDYSVFAQPALYYTKSHNRMNQDVRSHIINTQIDKALQKISEYTASRIEYEQKLSDVLFNDDTMNTVLEAQEKKGKLLLPFLCLDDEIYAAPDSGNDGSYTDSIQTKANTWNNILNRNKTAIISNMKSTSDTNIYDKLMKSVDDAIGDSEVNDAKKKFIRQGIKNGINSGRIKVSIPSAGR